MALDFWDNYSIRTKFIVHEKKGFFKLKVRLFFRLLSHDITEGIIHNRKFFIFAALLFIFIDFVYWHNISLYFSDYNSVVDCGVLDFFMNVFAGCDPFDPEANKGVDIPITWFSFNVLPYLFVGLYITNDLQTSADTFILRVKSRYLWWLSKIVWCVVSSTLYYLLFFVISTAFTLFSGNFSLLDLRQSSARHSPPCPTRAIQNQGFAADVPQRLPLLAQFHVSLFLCKAFSCPP